MPAAPSQRFLEYPVLRMPRAVSVTRPSAACPAPAMRAVFERVLTTTRASWIPYALDRSSTMSAYDAIATRRSSIPIAQKASHRHRHDDPVMIVVERHDLLRTQRRHAQR